VSKYLSRSFWIVLFAMAGAFALAWYLKDATPATVIVPAAITGWFGGKFAESMINRNGGGS